MRKVLFAIICCLSLTVGQSASAQCPATNTAFKHGETLYYDLYYNWKFVWIKAGTATMNITQTQYNGKPAYKTRLITNTEGRVDKFFTMRDTLVSYTDLNLVPQYYSKAPTRARPIARKRCGIVIRMANAIRRCATNATRTSPNGARTPAPIVPMI